MASDTAVSIARPVGEPVIEVPPTADKIIADLTLRLADAATAVHVFNGSIDSAILSLIGLLQNLSVASDKLNETREQLRMARDTWGNS